ASRLVVLQPLALNELPSHLRARTRVIYQSFEAPPRPKGGLKIEDRGSKSEDRGAKIQITASGNAQSSIPPSSFDVCVLGHLRPVKDPFRTALAARRLPASSRIRVRHAGAALSPAMEKQARQ